MSPVIVGIIGLMLLFLLLSIRLPVGFAMALIGLSGFMFLVSPEGGLTMAARACWDQFNSYSFSVVPLFILMGVITPPVGINVYIIKGVAKDVPLGTIFRGILPFLMADIVSVFLLLFVPQIALFLPSIIRY